jgi:hypothetical protein
MKIMQVQYKNEQDTSLQKIEEQDPVTWLSIDWAINAINQSSKTMGRTVDNRSGDDLVDLWGYDVNMTSPPVL